MALAKEFRLKKQRDFDKVNQQGQKFQTPLFTVYLLKDQPDGPKFGFVVSKRIDDKAVVRNKIKRWLGEAIKSVFSQLRKDIYAIFYVKKEIKRSNVNEIKNEIGKIRLLFEEK